MKKITLFMLIFLSITLPVIFEIIGYWFEASNGNYCGLFFTRLGYILIIIILLLINSNYILGSVKNEPK